MTHYDDRLKELSEKKLRKRQLEAMVRELVSQKLDLEARVNRLRREKQKEQSDVDELSKPSLSSFFYYITGRKQEKLDNETAEAYAAAIKCSSAEKELSDLEYDLKKYRGELRELESCEELYKKAFEEKASAIKALGGAGASRLLELEEKLLAVKSRIKELDEAISAGHSALSTAEEILSSLKSADGWAAVDVLGGGVISDIAKHSHLDKAQQLVNVLQSRLRAFKTELADVSIRADFQVNIDGFLHFADYFFDGIFVDIAVMNKIDNSLGRVYEVQHKLQSMMARLNDMERSEKAEETSLVNMIENEVKSHPLR